MLRGLWRVVGVSKRAGLSAKSFAGRCGGSLMPSRGTKDSGDVFDAGLAMVLEVADAEGRCARYVPDSEDVEFVDEWGTKLREYVRQLGLDNGCRLFCLSFDAATGRLDRRAVECLIREESRAPRS